ncbi:DUF1097 domain-containing protein [Saccharopolyspora karakumensis]|uniref:DUF1097 domain-containing protein n=1 Tax=Saccharopolyspora karakumensis TaxID=2530386 RepID=A0A4R5BUU2_9PSEU|nr:DUF1097 domain-containing protein [Saccharopolyspora karakumensis]TDD89456.1 DUF1097 domain-containing protein [Saccharopolyspora karakumensis]
MKSIPLWVAVPVTVAVALPFGLWLGTWSLPVWLAFIVWAEYFALGAKPVVLRVVVPSFLSGVVSAAIALIFSLLVGTVVGDAAIVAAGDVSWFVGLPLALVPLIYVMQFLPFARDTGSLPYFNGLSMGLATYFIGTYANFGGLSLPADSVLLPLITSVPAVLGGLLGAFLGWFNVAIMTPFGRPAPRPADTVVDA